MKYEAPIYENCKVEVCDIIAASGIEQGDVQIVENASGGADYKIDVTKLFGF